MTRAWQALAATLFAAALTSCASAPHGTPTSAAPAPVVVPPPRIEEPVPAAAASSAPTATASVAAGTRSGRDIYRDFRAGLASPQCGDTAGSLYRKQFRNAPERMANADDGDLLALFGYVVDAFREAGLPTEFTLIPFIESGYDPSARSHDGAAGLWQFVRLTARNQGIAIDRHYDGRLSPLESTQAAVNYFGHLYREFDGDWKLTIMGYNAGEFRIKAAMRRAKKTGRLPELSPITYAYVNKLHALSCLFEEAEQRDGWMDALDRQVPILHATQLPDEARSLDAWSAQQGQDAALLRQLNPDQRGALGGKRRVLAPITAAGAADAGGSR